MNIWMKVTHDRLQLPVAVADTAKELAEMIGLATPNSIYSTLSRAAEAERKGKTVRSRYVKVEVEEDETD